MSQTPDRSRLLNELRARFGSALRTRENVGGDTLTTFKLGGNVRLLVEPTTPAALCALLAYLESERVSLRVLGSGSNLLIRDRGVDDLVLRLGGEWAKYVFVDGAPQAAELEAHFGRDESGDPLPRVLAFGGLALMTFSRRMCEAGLSGLEFAAGIPASLGGAVRMNAGAHGSSMSAVLRRVYLATASGELRTMEHSELRFGYRTTVLPPHAVVLGALLELSPAGRDEVLARRNSALDYRKQTQPLQLPSAGSVFRNPPGGPPAGELLERAGLKGCAVGGVAFSTLHANWIVKLAPTAAAHEVEELIAIAQGEVAKRFGVRLEPELVVW